MRREPIAMSEHGRMMNGRADERAGTGTRVCDGKFTNRPIGDAAVNFLVPYFASARYRAELARLHL